MNRLVTKTTHGTYTTRRVAVLATTIAALGAIAIAPFAFAGGVGFRTPAVGGVHVDAAGILRTASADERAARLAMLRREIKAAEGEMAERTGLRMISLRRLQNTIADALAQPGGELSEEIRYLAGLQRIEYVFVYPEDNDIVIAGPAEPWVVRDDASVVGRESGNPVVMLDDLLVALRSVETARRGGISCSIEPTAEGYQRLNAVLRRMSRQGTQNPQAFEPAMREAFGPQQIKLNGIPAESHFARILVAADYQMKRIAMDLEKSGVKKLPGYLSMARNSISNDNANPRWWMACNYDAVSRTEDRMAWQVSGQGVKTMTETELVTQDGQVQGTGRVEPLAQRWADLMTEQFPELAGKQAVFGQLRNCMDAAVIATLIVQEDLETLSGCDLSILFGRESVVMPIAYAAPRAVAPECSFVRGARGWVVSASGGVDVNAFSVVENQRQDASIGEVRAKAAESQSASWWWNG